jgi:hypothetical protein
LLHTLVIWSQKFFSTIRRARRFLGSDDLFSEGGVEKEHEKRTIHIIPQKNLIPVIPE